MTTGDDERQSQGERGAEAPGRTDDGKQTLIGWQTAAILYALLLAACGAMLKGKALALGLIIVLGLAAKSFVHYLRERE